MKGEIGRGRVERREERKRGRRGGDGEQKRKEGRGGGGEGKRTEKMRERKSR